MDEPGLRTLCWTDVDPAIAGPGATTGNAGARPFVLPATPDGELRLGHIASGGAWPRELPPLDRTAAVPVPRPPDVARTRRGRAVLTLRDARGDEVPVCALSPEGAVDWSVDPVVWIAGVLAERYVGRWRRPLTSRIPGLNYARLPQPLKGLLAGLADASSGLRSEPAGFPGLPLDSLVEDLRRLCAGLAGGPAGGAPPWPEGRRAAIALTYDVDSAWILDDRRAPVLRRILAAERALGLRSTWFVVADQLSRKWHAGALHALREAGCELGAHGWNHDSRLLYVGPAAQDERMRRIRERFAGLDLEGIRTPWYGRSPALFAVLARHFGYDSSVPNASGFFTETTNSGCCSLLPYEPAPGLVELPMTLPPDTALPADESGCQILLAACARIVEAGGVVVVTMHPQPHQSGNPAALARYLGFLESLAERHGQDLWAATARDVVRRHRARVAAGAVPPALRERLPR